MAQGDCCTAMYHGTVEGKHRVTGLFTFASLRGSEYVAALLTQRLLELVLLTRKLSMVQQEAALVEVDQL